MAIGAIFRPQKVPFLRPQRQIYDLTITRKNNRKIVDLAMGNVRLRRLAIPQRHMRIRWLP